MGEGEGKTAQSEQKVEKMRKGEGEGKTAQSEQKVEKILIGTLGSFIGFFGFCLISLAVNLYSHQDPRCLRR